MIRRDRAPASAEAAHAGAPQAVQVADRGPLLTNMQEAGQRCMTRQHALIAQATTTVIARQLEPPTDTPGLVSMRSSREAKDVQRRRDRRYARCCRVMAFHQQGVSQDGMAEALGRHHATVRTSLRAGTFPERATYRLRSQRDPYVPSLPHRWADGWKKPTQVWRAMVAQGYRGTPRMIRRDVTRLRQRVHPLTPDQRAQWVQATPLFTKPAVRRASPWRVQLPQALTPEQEEFLPHLCELRTEGKAVRDLMPTFRQMVQARQAEVVPKWRETAEQSPVTAMRSCAAGMRQEAAAVAAALEHAWSNGQVERQIKKLKRIKRQMYGRAKRDLLQARLLSAA